MTIIYHKRYMEHRQGGFMHPECPERIEATIARLEEEGLWKDVVEPGPASLEDCGLIHSKEYLDLLKNFGEGPLDPDTYMRPETWDIALLSAGGGSLAGELAYKNKRPIMGLLRPPGHHATEFRAMGFCYLNNVAISAANMVAKGNGKVAIIDVDLHHGNGTNDSFWERDDVLYVSTHQYPHYPGTGGIGAIGEGKGKGYTVNLPFPGGCGDATFEYAFESLIEPVLRQFGPASIMVSIGGDSHYMDPLGSLTLSSQGYIGIIKRIEDMAKELCDNRISFYLEGGYDVNALAEIIAGIVATFEDKEIEYRYTDVRDDDRVGRSVVDKVAKTLLPYWDL
jgi:acetoin utilization deacetylase AcuC-like enzyme